MILGWKWSPKRSGAGVDQTPLWSAEAVNIRDTTSTFHTWARFEEAFGYMLVIVFFLGFSVPVWPIPAVFLFSSSFASSG